MLKSIKKYLSRLLKGEKIRRVSGADPSNTLPCAWCEKVGPTTVEEIWCKADPTGHLTRLCDNCKMRCAGG